MAADPIANLRSVFIDSSVMFAACYSASESARDLVNAAFQAAVTLVVSDYVLAETERNVLKSAPHTHETFLRFRASVPFRLVVASKKLINDAERVVIRKDAPVIAAASLAGVTFVAIYDCRDQLSEREEIFKAFGLVVAKPQEILACL